jgi:hypothetical protein
MSFGLWFEPEAVNPDSELYRAHPDWVLAEDGREKLLSRHELLLDLRTREEVRDYIVESSVCGVLDGADIAYVKWDMNRQSCALGNGGPRIHSRPVRRAAAHIRPAAGHPAGELFLRRKPLRSGHAVLFAADMVLRRHRPHRAAGHPGRAFLSVSPVLHGRTRIRRRPTPRLCAARRCTPGATCRSSACWATSLDLKDLLPVEDAGDKARRSPFIQGAQGDLSSSARSPACPRPGAAAGWQVGKNETAAAVIFTRLVRAAPGYERVRFAGLDA